MNNLRGLWNESIKSNEDLARFILKSKQSNLGFVMEWIYFAASWAIVILFLLAVKMALNDFYCNYLKWLIVFFPLCKFLNRVLSAIAIIITCLIFDVGLMILLLCLWLLRPSKPAWSMSPQHLLSALETHSPLCCCRWFHMETLKLCSFPKTPFWTHVSVDYLTWILYICTFNL